MRRVRTQVTLIQRVVTAVVIVVAAASMLLTFPEMQAVGTSMLASAGLLGIVAGIAAQSTLGNLFAGLQIAFGDMVRIGDTVVVDGEWGTVEEITLTFLTVRTWDERRITMPVSYFTSKPFENWSRGGAQMTGTVFFHLDHAAPMEKMRQRLHEILQECPDWDGRSWSLVVTDTTPSTIVVRALVTARDADTLWTVRCQVREQMVEWLQAEHAYALPRISTTTGAGRARPGPPGPGAGPAQAGRADSPLAPPSQPSAGRHGVPRRLRMSRCRSTRSTTSGSAPGSLRAESTSCRAAESISPWMRCTFFMRVMRFSKCSRRSSSTMSGAMRAPMSWARRASWSLTSSGSSSTSRISFSRRLDALITRTASSRSSASSASESARTRSLRTSQGSVRPCTTSVVSTTAKAMKRISSRAGKSPPPSMVYGMARASATEATPRIPDHHMMRVSRQLIGMSSS